MNERTIDWSIFEHLDLLIQELTKANLYNPIHERLSEILNEGAQVLACVDRIDALIQAMAADSSRVRLPEPWRREATVQIPILEEGYADLVSVATVILPRQALIIIQDRMQ